MSTPTLPRVVAPAGGRTIYAMTSLIDGTVAWTPNAGLLQAGFRWAQADDPIPAEHVTLTADAVTELICISRLDPTQDPTPRDVRSEVLLTLNRVHCDARAWLDEFALACWDSPAAMAERIRWAHPLAVSLLGGAG